MFAATLALGALFFAVAIVVGGATDEGSVAWSSRVIRALPLVPACGAAVTLLSLRRAERRGELLALESIGCSPARAALFVAIAASALSASAAGAVVFVSGASDAFFPRATARAEVRVERDGESVRFVDDARGTAIAIDGTLTHAPRVIAVAPEHERGRGLAAAIALVALGCALPLVAARSSRRVDVRGVALGAAMCALCIFLFQAVAAGRAPSVLVVVPASVLLVFAIVRYRAPAWS